MNSLEHKISSSDLEIVFEKAKKYAIMQGYREDCEDFAQDVVLYAFEKKSADLYLSRRLCDYLRKTYGRTGTPRNTSRFFAIEDFSEKIPAPDSAESFDRFGSDEIGDALARLTKYERLIYVITKKFSMEQDKIADCVGVSPSRIGQEIKRIQKIIDKTLKRNVSGIQGAREKQLEKILRKKRKRMAEGTFERLEEKESFGMESYFETSF